MNDESVKDEPVRDEPVNDGLPVASRGRARRLLGVVLPAVLVLGAVGGGVGYIGVTVQDADRSAVTEVWQKPDREPAPDPVAHAGKGRTDNELSRKLLPVPDGYRLGPDIGGDGNDSHFSARAATAMAKSLGDGLTGPARRSFDKAVDKLGVKGIALRTYTAYADDLVVQISLQQLRDPALVKSAFTRQARLMDAGEKGPDVEGHKKDATCMLVPEGDEESAESLSAMQCLAYDGDLVISVVAYGPYTFRDTAVADLLKEQLDHIADPGEYV
ncbi:hypothetical protein HA039_18700 [Streptomyces liangshanensis]|uniref:Secreted protein n=1 Tax=Streptomyces liangshanensis TaxID=2717324 RepID=A0A6G9H8X5_9ACTN|nr:hypothetical protein HA039_18700 [Streptomyces liangshanensis]